jgi:hypothetical protein
MSGSGEKQRRRTQRKQTASSVIQVGIGDGIGNSHWVNADLVDVIGSGCGLALMTLLRRDSTVAVRGELGEDRIADLVQARVRWCTGKGDGTFRAGLEFLSRWAGDDLYEVMQLSPRADAETISRVYRMLAFRYHPDNSVTGDREMFLKLAEAHEILGNPEKRAAYDLRMGGGGSERRCVLPGNEWEKQRVIRAVTAAYRGVSTGGDSRVLWEG